MRTETLVCVMWKDAVELSRTTEPAEKAVLAINRSVGFIQDEDDERIVLASEDGTTGEHNFSVIPKNWIIVRAEWEADRHGWFGLR